MLKRETFSQIKTGIVGGSIAGCSIGVLLRQLGFDVTILERSPRLDERGGAVIMPMGLVQQCIDLDLFDVDIPFLPIKKRSFYIKNSHESNKQIWQQSMDVVALNWGHVFLNLRKRFPDEFYCPGDEVKEIQKIDENYTVETSKGKKYKFDFIVAADGIGSTIRKKLSPESKPNYAGYIAWRGTTTVSAKVEQYLFDQQIAYFMFPMGHLLLYCMPSFDYEKTGNKILNWLLYECHDEQSLSQLLLDRAGKHHSVSLPPGSLTKDHLQHLHQFSRKVLPNTISDIICQTQNPFLQAIFDLEMPKYLYDKILITGDAGVIRRPHSGSGLSEALKASIKLFEILQQNKTCPLSNSLSLWNQFLLQSVHEQVSFSKRAGRFLVNTSSWQHMGHESMEESWKKVVRGYNWYATSSVMWKQSNLIYKPDYDESKNSAGFNIKAKL